MNEHMLQALAQQHTNELRSVAARGPRRHGDRPARSSLRERTGWTMVDLGLRLVAQPGPGFTRRTRLADSRR
jgi:hypothetical protein